MTKSTPMGSADRPDQPVRLRAGRRGDASSRARWTGTSPTWRRRSSGAAAHRGAAFVEILQNCNIYNDMAWGILYDRESKVEHELRVEHGKPLLFGPAHARKGLVLDGVRPPVVVNGR